MDSRHNLQFLQIYKPSYNVNLLKSKKIVFV